jgi:phosphoglycolate phosphatase-like HAD superfamily hydrolase
MTIEHIVWDWNGTLFDDGDALILATIDAFAAASLAEVTAERYRDHFTRPITDFYEKLAGRTLTPVEQVQLDAHFQYSYGRRIDEASLCRDAVNALTTWRDAGGTQSLLSMYPHDQLLGLRQLRPIASLFCRVRGTSENELHLKEPHLRQHLVELGIRPEQVLIVGDSIDDMHAAQAAGVPCVLYRPADRALLSLTRVHDLGVPVVTDLSGAVRLALNTEHQPVGGAHEA